MADQVGAYASSTTPDGALEEAARRLAGWLSESPAAFEQHNIGASDGTSATRMFARGSPIRSSGALAILAPYRQVRAFEGF